MNTKLKDKAMDDLFEAILCLRNKEECYDFFDDLCTALELKALSQRFQVARMLNEHHVYSEIVGTTGASTATISRVNRSLNYGSDGYKIVFDRLDSEKEDVKEESNE
ncbi:MAG: YerC/YecD family TrpR-related protein [Porcipelethomonas sp.]